MPKDRYQSRVYMNSRSTYYSVERVTYKGRKKTVVEVGLYGTADQAAAAKEAFEKGS